MLPTKQEAERLLSEAELCNPGPWGNHSRVSAYCAAQIAQRCEGLDADTAYILGLLHDIGRKFGIRHLGHVIDGYRYMESLGYPLAARICLTHSFNNQRIEDYVGKYDTTEEETHAINEILGKLELNDYDRLIQLCDALAGNDRVLDIEARMNDVKNRYGFYPQAKWDANLRLKAYFEAWAGENIYQIVKHDSFRLG